MDRMIPDLTVVAPTGWSVLKKALNQRIVHHTSTLVPSKRNRVWIVETDVRPVVLKQFLSSRCAEEFETLVRAKKADLRVPYPFHMEDGFLVMEYLQGESCEAMINHLFSYKVAEGIGAWLASFHKALGDGSEAQIVSDAVLSNFVYHDGEVYGVDLEDSRPGDPLEDLGEISASVLSSEPMFNPIKFDLCRQLLRSYERASGAQVVDPVRPYVARFLRKRSVTRPLFRRTFAAAADSLEHEWPELA